MYRWEPFIVFDVPLSLVLIPSMDHACLYTGKCCPLLPHKSERKIFDVHSPKQVRLEEKWEIKSFQSPHTSIIIFGVISVVTVDLFHSVRESMIQKRSPILHRRDQKNKNLLLIRTSSSIFWDENGNKVTRIMRIFGTEDWSAVWYRRQLH